MNYDWIVLYPDVNTSSFKYGDKFEIIEKVRGMKRGEKKKP